MLTLQINNNQLVSTKNKPCFHPICQFHVGPWTTIQMLSSSKQFEFFVSTQPTIPYMKRRVEVGMKSPSPNMFWLKAS